MVSVCVTFWGVIILYYFSFLNFGGVLNKTIIPLALVGYDFEMLIPSLIQLALVE